MAPMLPHPIVRDNKSQREGMSSELGIEKGTLGSCGQVQEDWESQHPLLPARQITSESSGTSATPTFDRHESCISGFSDVV
jgi:hypothetical protein